MDVSDILARHYEMLVSRVQGPLAFRFMLQPLVATLLAIRAGLRDAREGRRPFLEMLVLDSSSRHELLRLMWKDVAQVFAVALAIDVVYELIVYRWLYPLQALIVAATLALVPYALLRGPVARISRLFVHRKAV